MTTPVRNTNNSNFDEILERCLHAIEQGQATVESCTARFPEYKELGAALRMAVAIRGMPRPPMSAAFTAKTRQQLQSHLRAVVQEEQIRTRPPRRVWSPFVRLMLAIGVVTLVLLGGFGVTRASANALPGDSLYPVKRVVESAELLFTSVQTQVQRTGVLFHIAQTRLGELTTLSARRRAISNDFLTDVADSVNHAYLTQPHTSQSDQLVAQAVQALQLAAASGMITTQAADNTASKLVAAPTGTLVTTSPTLTPGSIPSATATAQPPTQTTLPVQASTRAAALTRTPTPTFTPTPSESPTQPASVTPSPVIPTNISPVISSPTNAALGPTVAGLPPVPTVVPATATLRVPVATTKATLPPASNTPAVTEAATSAVTEAATEAPTEATAGAATEAATEAVTEAAAPTDTPTLTPSPTASSTRTPVPTRTPRPTRTPTLTWTPTNTPTATATITLIPMATPDVLPPTSFKQPPQVGTFDTCPAEGQGGDPAFNRLRNRIDEGQYQPVGLDILLNLPWPKEVERKPRDQWPGSVQDQVNRADGLPLTVEGYLVQVQQKAPDGQNCQSQDNVNWQVWMTSQAKGDSGKALIAQITPRIRANHPSWTLDRLKAAVSSGLKVRVSGWLVLDPENPDEIGKARGTLWELTPVMQIAVAKDGQPWVSLDDYQP